MVLDEWLCGGCGARHGWICPYFGYPGESLKWSQEKQDDAERRMKEDKKGKRGVFEP